MIIKTFENIIGLDISDLRLRLCQLDFPGKKKQQIKCLSDLTVPAGYISDGIIKKEKEVIDLLKNLFARPFFGKIKKTYINASLPEKKTFIKTITIPKVTEDELLGTVGWGIEQNIPVSLDQIYYDWQIIPSRIKNNEEKMTVAVAVAPKELIDSYIRVTQAAGLTLIGLEIESLAICRSLIEENNDCPATLLIDMGRSRTTLIFYSQNTIQFTTTLDVNGQEMTAAIAKMLKLSITDAEKAKIICGLDKRRGRGAVRNILEPILGRLINKIRENLEYFDIYLSTGQKISQIILTGSVSQMVNLTDYVQEKLKIKVSIGNPLTNFAENKKLNKLMNKINLRSFTTAIGLAQKRFK